jgi:rhodanese-related sulfurtransferase
MNQPEVIMKLLLFVFLLLGVSFAQTSYTTVTVQDLANAQEDNYFILDVRQSEEFAEGHVPNAVLIPLGELQTRASEIPSGVPVYVICRSGRRSQQASEILIELGFKDVRNVDGGVLAWQEAGYELTTE